MILRRNEVVDTLANDGFAGVGLHHAQANRVHVQQSAVGSNQLDVLLRCFNDGAEPLFAFFCPAPLLLDRLEQPEHCRWR